MKFIVVVREERRRQESSIFGGYRRGRGLVPDHNFLFSKNYHFLISPLFDPELLSKRVKTQ